MTQRLGLFVAIGLIAAAAPAAAQMAFGFKGGATFSTADVEDPGDADFGYRTGIPSGGVFLSIPLGANLAFQPEVLYMRKGTTITDEDDFADVDFAVELDYVEVPVLLVVPIGTSGGSAPYLIGGGAVAFEAGCAFSLDGQLGGQDVSEDVDCDEGEELDLEFERKKVDFGAVLGAGIRIPAGTGAFLIEGRYTLGLTDLDDSGQEEAGIKNRSIAAFIGYSFAIGR